MRCAEKLSNRSFPSLRVHLVLHHGFTTLLFIEIIMLFKHVDDSFEQYANNRVYVLAN